MSCRSRLSVLNEKLTYLETKVDHIETRGTNGDEEQKNQLHNCTDMSQGNELLLNDFSLWWVNTCFNIICDLKFAFKIAIKYIFNGKVPVGSPILLLSHPELQTRNFPWPESRDKLTAGSA